MGDEDAGGAGFGDRRQQRGPVGVIGQDEAAIERTLAADAADAHQARRERVRGARQPLHPARAARRERRQYQRLRERLSAHVIGDPLRGRHCHAGVAVADHVPPARVSPRVAGRRARRRVGARRGADRRGLAQAGDPAADCGPCVAVAPAGGSDSRA